MKLSAYWLAYAISQCPEVYSREEGKEVSDLARGELTSFIECVNNLTFQRGQQQLVLSALVERIRALEEENASLRGRVSKSNLEVE